MLKVTIDVNGKVIEVLTARRIQELHSERSEYDYLVKQGEKEIGFLKHTYEAGALRLAELLCRQARLG